MIKIKLFAYLQEMVDANEIEVAVANDTPTTADLKQAVAGAYPVVAAYLPPVRLAVDEAFVGEEAVLDITETHEYALIPPVSGG